MIKNKGRSHRKKKGLEKGREIIVLPTNAKPSELMETELIEKMYEGTDRIKPPRAVFRLVKELKSGSYKHVWKARSLEGDDEIAVQFLKTEHLGEYKNAHSRSEPSKISNAAVRNFMGIETRIAREIQHEHIAQGTGFGVAVVDSPEGEDISVPFTTAKLAPKTLGDLLQDKNALNAKDAVWTVNTLLQIGKALEHVRWKGIIEAHGDLQKGNLLFMDDDYNRLVVTDFGVANAVVRPGEEPTGPMRPPPKTIERTATIEPGGQNSRAIHHQLYGRTRLPTLVHDVYSLGYWGIEFLKYVENNLKTQGDLSKVNTVLEKAGVLYLRPDSNKFPPRAPGPGTNMLSEFLDQLSEAAGMPYVHHDPRYYMPSLGKHGSTLAVSYDFSKLTDDQRRYFKENPDELEKKVKQARVDVFRPENSGIFGMANSVKSEMAECIKALNERYKDCEEETELVLDRQAEGGVRKIKPLQKASIIISENLFDLLNRHYAQLSELVEAVGDRLREERHNMVGLTDMIHMEEDKYKALKTKIDDETKFADRVEREIYSAILLTENKSLNINKFHKRYGALLTKIKQQKAYIETFDILHSNVQIERDKVRLSEEAQRNVDEAMAAKAEAEGQAEAYRNQKETSAAAFREQIAQLEKEKANAEQTTTYVDGNDAALEQELKTAKDTIAEQEKKIEMAKNRFLEKVTENKSLKKEYAAIKKKLDRNVWKKLVGWGAAVSAVAVLVSGGLWLSTRSHLQGAWQENEELRQRLDSVGIGDAGEDTDGRQAADAGAGDADLGFITRGMCEQLSVLGYLPRERCEGLPETRAAEEPPEPQCPAVECPAERPAAKCLPPSVSGGSAVGTCTLSQNGLNYSISGCTKTDSRTLGSEKVGSRIYKLRISQGRAGGAEVNYTYTDEHGQSCTSREWVSIRNSKRIFKGHYHPDAWYSIQTVLEKEQAASRRRVKRYTDPFD